MKNRKDEKPGLYLLIKKNIFNRNKSQHAKIPVHSLGSEIASNVYDEYRECYQKATRWQY